MDTGMAPREIRTSMISAGIESGGKALALYHQDGEYYVAGEPGAAYSVVVVNLTGSRVEVVTSVDGRNTLEDEEASIIRNTGLVIPAFGRYRFVGWRLDDDTIREFLFGAELADSVVAQSGGDTANKGVIGIAAWQEKRVQPEPAAGAFRAAGSGPGGQSVSAIPSASAGGTAPVRDDLSTGIGEARQDRVGRTSFVRGTGPDMLLIRYASQESLVARGIINPRLPDPFPGDGSGYGSYRSPGDQG